MRYFPSLAVKASNLKFGLMSSAGLALLGLGLTGCETITVPEPKYPVYMMDRPASSAPVLTAPPVEAAPYITPVPSAGEVTTNYLPPAPPSPPAAAPATAWAPAPQPVYAPPPPPLPVAAQPSAQSYVYAYVMQPHDTLFGVSRRFGVTIQSIYAANNLTATSPVSVGQRILLPATARDKGPEERASGQGLIQVSLATAVRPVPAPPPPPVIVNPPLLGPPVAPPPVTPVQPVQPPLPNKAFPSGRDLTTLGQGMFMWPTRGSVVVKYGQLAPNVRNDGLNIAAPKGTPVVAAADGVVLVVLTVQNQTTRDLGNTIYIQNGNGWYTGYSHLDMVTVKAQQRVKQGQLIGTVGQTGAVDKPQLHFEIRYTPSKEMAKPIDPNLVLPAYR